jgi:hypothetical protein
MMNCPVTGNGGVTGILLTAGNEDPGQRNGNRIDTPAGWRCTSPCIQVDYGVR